MASEGRFPMTAKSTPSRPRSALAGLDARMNPVGQRAEVPKVGSFRDYLERFGRVKTSGGIIPFTFVGREPMAAAVDRIDEILGSHTGKPLVDAVLAICGGAQWGKTVLGLNFIAYVTGILGLNIGYYLPDDDLVQGVVDVKFRPELVDVQPWFADMLTLGKTVNKSGRSVNRKGAFMVSGGGEAPAMGMFIGLNKKVPTTFSQDVTVEDEKDDIKSARAKFLKGRMTSSALRFQLIIGTQRIAGAGQNAEFEAGSQEVYELIDPESGEGFCPEEHWPQICRVAMDGTPRTTDPKLTNEGVFKRDGSPDIVATFDHEAHYYLANPQTGTPLDRRTGRIVARRPERIKERKFSIRISQIGIAAIALVQIVADWRDAVADPEKMIAFRCDRLAMPASTLQQLDQKILERARTTGDFVMGQSATEGTVARYAGLDTGDRCWFSVRDAEASPLVRRMQYAEMIALGRVKERAVELFHRLGISCLFIDARPAAEEARHITWAVHGLLEYEWPKIPDPEKTFIQFPGGLSWDGPQARWRGLRASVVEFALKDGQGVRHKLGITQEGKFFPVIQCNRDESIQAVINELLTIEEGLVHVVEGKVRTEPILRMPSTALGASPAATIQEQHFLTGSKKEKATNGEEHFVDNVENHYLLAATYARLAESIGGRAKAEPTVVQSIPRSSASSRSELSAL